MGMTLKDFKAAHAGQFGNLVFHEHAVARCRETRIESSSSGKDSKEARTTVCDMPGRDVTLAGYKVRHWLAYFYKERLYEIVYDNFDVKGYADIERSLNQIYGEGQGSFNESYDIPDDLSIPPSHDFQLQTFWTTNDLLIHLGLLRSTPIAEHPDTSQMVELTFTFKPILEEMEQDRSSRQPKPF